MASEVQEREMPRIGGRPRDAMTDDALGVNPQTQFETGRTPSATRRDAQSEIPVSVGSESALRGSAKRNTLPLCSR
jgi:hypothetical protein